MIVARVIVMSNFWIVLDFGLPTLNTPGEEGLVLFYGVQLVGGGVAPLTGQLSLGVVCWAGPRDVDIAPAQVAAALQGGRGRAVHAVYNDAGREEVLVLEGDSGTLVI